MFDKYSMYKRSVSKSKQNVCVVIPVYKVRVSKSEESSLKACISILSDFPLCFVCSEFLDMTCYDNLVKQRRNTFTLNFEQIYFDSVAGYNRLLMSLSFYQKFSNFKFMLVYQLDAFVFKDELSEWCDRNFDYIGAPWMDDIKDVPYYRTKHKIGNGGFSLRKISYCLKVLKCKTPFLSVRSLLREYASLKPLQWLTRLPLICMRIIGYRNTVKYYVKHLEMNEDIFWSVFCSYSWFGVFKPDFMLGLRFAFEREPRLLYKINDMMLPFGCHAWEKYDKEFWKAHIPELSKIQ